LHRCRLHFAYKKNGDSAQQHRPLHRSSGVFASWKLLLDDVASARRVNAVGRLAPRTWWQKPFSFSIRFGSAVLAAGDVVEFRAHIRGHVEGASVVLASHSLEIGGAAFPAEAAVVGRELGGAEGKSRGVSSAVRCRCGMTSSTPFGRTQLSDTMAGPDGSFLAFLVVRYALLAFDEIELDRVGPPADEGDAFAVFGALADLTAASIRGLFRLLTQNRRA